MNKQIIRGLVAAGVIVATSSANAAVDVSAAVTEIGAIAVPAGLIGVAMLTVLATIKGWKLIRRAM